MRIGELLVSQGQLTEDQLKEALAWKAKTKARFGEVLTELGFVREEQVIHALAAQFEHPVADLTQVEPQPEAIALISAEVAIKYLCLPLECDPMTATVALSDPLDIEVMDFLQLALKRRIHVSLATPTSLRRAINKAYLRSSKGKLRNVKTKTQKDRALLLEIIDGGKLPGKRKRTTKEAA